MSPPHPVIAQFKQIREAEGLTQTEVARLAGYDRGIICRMERGRSIPHITLLADVAEAIGWELKIVPKQKV